MKHEWRLRYLVFVATLVVFVPRSVAAAEWFVAPGGTGTGTATAPFGRIQDALNAAQPGDAVTVRSGTYAEALRTVRGGAAGAPIVLRAQGTRGSVVVTVAGLVLSVTHPYVTVDGLVLDGQYGTNNTVALFLGADHFVLRNTEVRRSSRNLVAIRSQGVLIDGCLIHHGLNPTDGRSDAHGVVGVAPIRDLTIRNTEIHTFSGDGVQLDPARAAPGWDRLTIEHSRIWLAPLPAAENGFAAGVIPGENAVDTKASASFPRAKVTLRDVTAWGFRSSLPGLTNAAAFNLKENIDATVDGATVYDSTIAFRLRGPSSSRPAGAWIAVKNAVVYNVSTGVRYENNIQNLRVWNSTIGAGVARAFQPASSTAGGLDVRNLLVLGPLPVEASGLSNLAVSTSAFANAAAHDYKLSSASNAIDNGITLPAVLTDRVGVVRPQGSGYDIGAYEKTSQPQPPQAPTADLSVSPSSIASGQSATLSWSTANATTVSIQPAIGQVALQGTRQIMPVVTTTYTLTAANSAGASVTRAVSVTVVASNQPPTVQIVSPPPGTTYTAPAQITIEATASDLDGSVSRVQFWNGPVMLGEDLASPYSFTWNSVSPGNYVITARAYDDRAAPSNAAQITIAVTGASQGSADLAISHEHTFLGPYRRGATITYSFSITNNGPSPATGVEVTDSIPSGVTVITSAASQGTCTSGGAMFTCALGALPVGKAAFVTLTVRPVKTGRFTNRASVTSAQQDPVRASNQSSATVRVLPCRRCGRSR